MNERVAIYARVSTDDQAERQTIESQLVACREHVTRGGGAVLVEFKDEGVSGALPFEDRPAGDRLLEAAADGLFGRVIIYSADRLARDLVEASLAMRAFKRLGLAVEFVSASFDDTPEGVLQFQMLSAFSEYERHEIRRRTAEGRVRRARDGKYMASVPAYGYRKGDDGRPVIHPDEANVVRMIFGWCVEANMGLASIAGRLNEKGVPPPANFAHPYHQSKHGWHISTIGKLLAAERYAGKGQYGSTSMAYPAIIEEETFRDAREAVHRRHKRSQRNTKGVYLAQHIARCRECAGAAVISYGGRARVPVYRCSKQQRYGEPHNRCRWPARAVDALITNWLAELLRDPQRALAEVELFQEQEWEKIKEQGDEAGRLDWRLGELQDEEMRVVAWARKGHVTEEVMIAQLDQLHAERRDISARLRALRDAAIEYDPMLLAPEFRQWATEWITDHNVDVLDNAETVRDTIRRLVRTVWLEDDGSVTVEGALQQPRVEVASPQF